MYKDPKPKANIENLIKERQYLPIDKKLKLTSDLYIEYKEA